MFNLVPLAADIPLHAQSPWAEHGFQGGTYLQYLTNSIFVSALVVVFILLWSSKATGKMAIVPGGTQNLFESIVESLYDTLEGIVGTHMIGKAFGLLASLFLFILVANWFAILPGVGSIGWGEKTGFLSVDVVTTPLLRPATADLNMTFALALVFMVFWLYWTIAEMGVGGFAKHIFGVKGGLTGATAIVMFPIFFFVGIIEVVSIAFRPVSLSLRLFGNVFAGENLLVTMITLGKELGLPTFVAYIMGVIVPIPFYFLELLVGVLQAMVFTLLCAVYLQLSTTHDDDH